MGRDCGAGRHTPRGFALIAQVGPETAELRTSATADQSIGGLNKQKRERDMEYGIIGWIVVGLIAGILAKWIMPGDDPGGIIITILIGIAGGLLGGFLATKLGIGGGNIVNILIATAGAILLLILYRVVRPRRA
jgi:uncharacterized membrane protein YeaQ/YmgE (transglycosylase-associated protein family)